MDLSDYSLDALKTALVIDDQSEPNYFSGPNLVSLFASSVGIRDIYEYGSGGFVGDGLRRGASRKEYTLSRLKHINHTKHLKNFLEYYANYGLSRVEEGKRNEIIANINNIIRPDGYALEKYDTAYRIIGNTSYDETVEARAHFEDIQQQIIDEIRKAKYTIWVAVAWFTDDVIFNELVQKSREGVNVQVIINDDGINANGGLAFEDSFETYKVQPWGMFDNIMHNKFCVIDLKTVISGSYNWTKKAAFNDESIEIVKSRELAEQYGTEFIKLKTK